jgi:hypothetical protein
MAAPSPDDRLTVGQLARLLPGAAGEPGKCAAKTTVRRWANRGVTVAGKVVRLRVTRTPGGVRLIRWGDYLSFRAECARLRGEPAEPVRTPAERRRESRGLRAEFDRVFGGK